MDYLSFDVGIKNLAYCILTPEKKIVGWDIINLNKNPLCQIVLNKKCQKQATYHVMDSEVDYCCTTHKEKCKKVKKIKKDNLFQLSQLCLQELIRINVSNVKYILIENQPVLKNPTMKSIQMIIYTFFVLQGVMNDSSTIKEVHMVNARNKLNVYKGPAVICPYNDDKKNKYRKNKFLSIKYTEKMIQDDKEEFQELFKESKKKDDLADAYLQGIYWIQKSI
tara:strand:- start:1525 stop:2190 length:666 start_codon:yes stop_codon:yes gene_type:complete